MRLDAGLGAGQAWAQAGRWHGAGRAGRACGRGRVRRVCGAQRARRRQGARHKRWGAQASGRAAGRAGARLGARCARGTAGRQHERAACARRLGQLGQVGVLCTRLGFQPGFSTRYFS